MDFKNSEELLAICGEQDMKISAVMLRRECDETECSESAAVERMRKALEIMRRSVQESVASPRKSMGGLIGGEAAKLSERIKNGVGLCGGILERAICYSMGVLEVNASMGLIVAAPTAGSIGYLAMRNATVAGAVGGCQAEIGVASAMAASAAVELMGGTPKQSLNAASTVLMNMLGLVCDPVGGLVEYPCQSRNASGAANALVAAEIALAGVEQLIPFSEMLEAMYKVGKKLPAELRETALGGCAATPSACRLCGRHGRTETD